MPIKLYASTVVKATVKGENELADEQLARISAGIEDDELEDEPGFLDEEDSDEDEDLEDDEDLEEESDEEEEDGEEADLADHFDLLTAFFKICPAPNDQQFHYLAQAIGMAPEDLEAMVYKVMSIMLENDDSKGVIDEAIEDAEGQDLQEADVEPYEPAEAEEDGVPDMDTLPIESASANRLRYSLSRR